MITHPSKGMTKTDLQEAVDTDLEAMVSCTPLDGDKPVLPTKQVPYAKVMKWTWDITEPVYVDNCLVVAKVEHHFKVSFGNIRPGDEAEISIHASDLEHPHGM